MQSRLAATVSRSSRLLISGSQSSPRRFASAVIPTGLTADPAIHSRDPEGIDAEEAAEKKQTDHHKPTKEMEPFVPPKPPYSPSPKLESTGVNQRLDPITQQKRGNTNTTTTSTNQLEEVSCTGFVPWVEGREREKQRMEEEEEDDKEYFEHHEASPSSEIEVADTRKPVTRAIQGKADAEVDGMVDYYYRGEGVVLWRPEQLETAEDSLRRATEMWRQNAMRGDPDSPHGRVLRALRGEDW